VLKKHAVDVLADAIGQVPTSAYASEVAFRSALQSALGRAPARSKAVDWTYDITTGKLKLKTRIMGGEVTGEFNPYTAALGGLSVVGLKTVPQETPSQPIPTPPRPQHPVPPPRAPRYLETCVLNGSPVAYGIAWPDVLAIHNAQLVGKVIPPFHPAFRFMISIPEGVYGVDVVGVVVARMPSGHLVAVGQCQMS
jgi:hypothetical protein